jgi:hypothetical protein
MDDPEEKALLDPEDVFSLEILANAVRVDGHFHGMASLLLDPRATTHANVPLRMGRS